jgi:hypothetical protein
MNGNIVVIKIFNKYFFLNKQHVYLFLKFINSTIHSHMWLLKHQQTFLFINKNFKKNEC